MTVDEIKVVEDPPHSNQNTTKGQKPSDILIQWNPEFHGSVSTNNGQGEIITDSLCVPALVYKLLKTTYGQELDDIVDNVKFNSFISRLRKAKHLVEHGSKFCTYFWESDDDTAVHVELNWGSLQMKDVINEFQKRGLDRGNYLGHITGTADSPITHMSQNESGIYLAQASHNGTDEPNIVELEPEEITGITEDISEIDDYKSIKLLVKTIEGKYCLEPFEEKIEIPRRYIERIRQAIRDEDYSFHLMDISHILFGEEFPDDENDIFYD